MPITNAPVGDNATISYSLSGTAGSYIAFANIEDITGNKIDVPKVITTKIDNAAVTKQGGVPDCGAIGVKFRFLKSMLTTVLGWVNNKTSLWFQVATDPSGPTPGTVTATGFIGSIDPLGTLTQNKEIITDGTIEISGAGTLT